VFLHVIFVKFECINEGIMTYSRLTCSLTKYLLSDIPGLTGLLQCDRLSNECPLELHINNTNNMLDADTISYMHADQPQHRNPNNTSDV
jgi:hypothetical protein